MLVTAGENEKVYAGTWLPELKGNQLLVALMKAAWPCKDSKGGSFTQLDLADT